MNETPPEVVPSETLEAFCLFQCGQTHLAIRLESVAEVLEVDRIVELPLGPDEIVGLCTLRREVVPVVSLKSTNSDRDRGSKRSAMVLIVRSERGVWALEIENVGTTVTTERMTPCPERTEGADCLVVKGVCRRDSADYHVMDANASWLKIKERIEIAYSRFTTRETRAPDNNSGNKLRLNSKFSVKGLSIRGLS